MYSSIKSKDLDRQNGEIKVPSLTSVEPADADGDGGYS